jgi:hypothetical protein
MIIFGPWKSANTAPYCHYHSQYHYYQYYSWQYELSKVVPLSPEGWMTYWMSAKVMSRVWVAMTITTVVEAGN